jgi:hypothetical protein
VIHGVLASGLTLDDLIRIIGFTFLERQSFFQELREFAKHP